VQMLIHVEWCGRFARCPSCWSETDQGHQEGCDLANLLREIEEDR